VKYESREFYRIGPGCFVGLVITFLSQTISSMKLRLFIPISNYFSQIESVPLTASFRTWHPPRRPKQTKTNNYRSNESGKYIHLLWLKIS